MRNAGCGVRDLGCDVHNPVGNRKIIPHSPLESLDNYREGRGSECRVRLHAATSEIKNLHLLIKSNSLSVGEGWGEAQRAKIEDPAVFFGRI